MAEQLSSATPGPRADAGRARVTVLPSGLQFPMSPGETVFEAALRAGLRWPTICDRYANCGICLSEVVEGGAYCSPISTEERETVHRVAGPAAGPRRRLACRLQVDGPVTVVKRGVRACP